MTAPAPAVAAPRPSRAARRRRTSLTVQAVVFVAVLVLLALLTDWGALAENVFNFGAVAPMFPGVLLVGLGNTLFYTATAFVVGLLGGALLALMRMSSFAPYRWLATAYVEFFRGVPALLVFLAFGYGVPFAFGVSWPIPVVVMLALGMVSAAYIAETLRAGLQAVPRGQMEAARSLGMPHWRAMVTIVIPQALRIVLPPLTNEVILLTKDSSLVYVLGLAMHEYELTKFGRDGISALDAGMTPILVAGLCYLVITVPLSLLARRFEARSSRKAS
ncbi:amino acid ABC transporter permease [Micrococcus sp.]|uniref:amino acid ABC transporter permease n=1 Tax=Micrococcus sp. TaxID=1271 RepID=UPI002A91FED2|nr:amino acid ABC transporter permease [Micrococcus sp.]MDY6055255.1 amino acid ABC transporter permease [Micrococcus sp.]